MRANQPVVLIVLFIALIIIPILSLAANEAPESLVNAARQGSVESADLFTVVNEANSFLNRVATDRAYASKFFAEIQENDRAGIVGIVKQTAPRSQVTVEQLSADYQVVVEFSLKTRKVTLCLSKDKGCSGKTSSVGVK